MSSPYLNQLSATERQDLINQLLDTQSGNCFICCEPIDLEIHRNHIDIDHIESLRAGGKDTLENFAVSHDSCNRSKQSSDLRVARRLAYFDKIAKSIASQNRSPNLGDILTEHEGAKYHLPVTVDGTSLRTSFPDLGQNALLTFPIYEDQISGFRYSFLNLPIEYLHHDDHINPRAIGSNLRKLVEEFHKKFPQLHIALGWITTSHGDGMKVKIFDGQHKAAAQILLGARHLPVRVFIDPNTDVLLAANTNAGTTLRQVAFDKSVQRSLGSSLLSDRIDRYRRDCGRGPDDENFSERDLVKHFKGESKEMKRYVIDSVRNRVTRHPENKLRDYIEYGGRSAQMPFSYSTVEKTFYSFFIYSDLLETPFNFRVEEGENPRQLEIEQLVRLMNIIAEKIYIGKFDPSLGTKRIEHNVYKGKDVPEPHLCAFRMAREEVLYNWLGHVRALVSNYFTLTTGKIIDERKLFQYTIPEACWENIKNFIDALMRLPLWVNKDLASSVFGGKRNYDYWHSIFENGHTPPPASSRVMATGINVIEMIKQK